MFCMDNYQVGQTLRTPRGGKGNNHLSGTNQMAHKMEMFEDDVDDDYYAELTYSTDQNYVSPKLMPSYENSKDKPSSKFFLDHKDMPQSERPDCTGDRNRQYYRRLKMSKWVDHVKHVFLEMNAENDPRVGVQASNVDMDKIISMSEICNMNSAKLLFHACSTFQREAVKKWNPNADEVTLSNYMGLVGIDEAASKECGALTLDMLLKFGILEQDGDGMWQLTENWEAKRAFLIGDVKTVDNVDKIAEDLSNRPLSLKESSQQAEVFAKALKNVMTIPGDWHAGLTMLQSIMNVFWDGFIEPFVKALKWKKVYKDCRNCYYRTSSLVLLVHNELIGHLMQTYVSEFGEAVRSKFENEEADKSPESYICYFAESFASWVDELANGDDNWLKACCLFITMSKDFFTFVDSYCSADAIGVEIGYQASVAV